MAFECSLLGHHTGVSDEASTEDAVRQHGGALLKYRLLKEKTDHHHIQHKQKDSESEPISGSKAWRYQDDEDGEQVTSAVVVESSEPVKKTKKDSKVAGFMKMFQRAWFASGEEMSDDHKPFVSRQAMLDFLIQNDGNTEENAKQMVKPGKADRFIGYLINGEIIRTKGPDGKFLITT